MSLPKEVEQLIAKEQGGFRRLAMKEGALIMQQHADSQAVAFAEWLGFHYKQNVFPSDIWFDIETGDRIFSTKQLFEKFKSQL